MLPFFRKKEKETYIALKDQIRGNAVEILHFYLPERYERRLRFLSQTDGRIAKAIVIAKRLCAFRLMLVKFKCAEGNTEDKLSPSSVMNSTQLAYKYEKFYFCSIIKAILE